MEFIVGGVIKIRSVQEDVGGAYTNTAPLIVGARASTGWVPEDDRLFLN
jgi:hypothetical protein